MLDAIYKAARAVVNVFPTQPKVQARIKKIEDRYDIMYQQLSDVVQQMGGLIPPPEHLQSRVIGKFSPRFISSGETIVSDLRAILTHGDRALESFSSILDFGCGCGRVLRTLYHHARPDQRLFGTDIDAEAIAWCSANYGKAATFDCNPTMPPMCYVDDQFDFVYSVSVFTHLPEDMQWAWLSELKRITKAGAHLALSFHGVNYYSRLEGELKAEFDRTGFVYGKFAPTPGLPDFYHTAWHSYDYIRSRWSEVFDILHIQPRGFDGLQDVVLCRNRS